MVADTIMKGVQMKVRMRVVPNRAFTLFSIAILAVLLLSTAVGAQSAVAGRGLMAPDDTLHPGTVIFGYVYDDVDMDGVRDPEDLPLEGVYITVRLPGTLALPGTLLAPVATDADGYYEVTIAPADYVAGSYTVTQSTPRGYLNVTPAVVTIPVAQDEHVQVDFADYRAIMISGTLFEDLDRDGLQDAGESGLAGLYVTVRMPAGGTLLTPVITDGDGSYEVLVPLALNMPGEYRVTAFFPPAYFETTPNPVDLSLDLREGAVVNFGARQFYRIWLPLVRR
jgi:hypothetical protein